MSCRHDSTSRKPFPASICAVGQNSVSIVWVVAMVVWGTETLDRARQIEKAP